jgi:hypothetical protein
METIVGFGTTQEGGDVADTLQEANVPVTADGCCAGAYGGLDATTMACAEFPEGGARPGEPGVYARAGDSVLRGWIRSIAPDGVD